MKKLLLYTITVLLSGTAGAQSPIIKLYAFSQETMPGIKPASPEDGKEINNALPVGYYIYAEVKRGAKVDMPGICIKGVWHSTILQKVNTPVLAVVDAVVIPNKKRVLVKKTRNDVYRIIPGEASEMAMDAAWQQLAAANEVVVAVQQANKKNYATVQKIGQLPQLAGM
jgi:hypothetical protein